MSSVYRLERNITRWSKPCWCCSFIEAVPQHAPRAIVNIWFVRWHCGCSWKWPSFAPAPSHSTYCELLYSWMPDWPSPSNQSKISPQQGILQALYFVLAMNTFSYLFKSTGWWWQVIINFHYIFLVPVKYRTLPTFLRAVLSFKEW